MLESISKCSELYLLKLLTNEFIRSHLFTFEFNQKCSSLCFIQPLQIYLRVSYLTNSLIKQDHNYLHVQYMRR